MTEKIVIHHTANGTPYARPYLGTSPITGRKIRPYREFPGMTDEEAEKAAKAWLNSIADTSTGDAQRLGDMLAHYVNQMHAQGCSHNTVKTYRLFNRRYAAPLARVPVNQVTPAQLDQLFLRLLTRGTVDAKPLSPNTVKKFREYMKGAFRYFVSLGLIEGNPIADTMPIRATHEDAQALDETDLQRLNAWIGETLTEKPDTNSGIIRRNAALGMLIALHTGARVGEVCALRRRDVNLTAQIMSINGNVVTVNHEAVRQSRTKGKRTRNVSLDSTTTTAIRIHLGWQVGYLQRADRNTPICTSDGNFMTPDTLSEQFRHVRRSKGLDPLVTFHSLRHTHATMLLQGGTEIQTVSERLGHAQPSTTLNIYAHVLEGRDRAAAATFDRLVCAKSEGVNGVPTHERQPREPP